MSQHVWLQHYPKEVPPTYDYPKQHLARFLTKTASAYPKQKALYFLGKTINYEQLLDACFRFGNGLKSLGIQKGDRVAIMLPNCPQSVIAYYGAVMIGAIVVQTNPLYVERELEHQMQDSGAIAIVTLDILFKRVKNVAPATKLQHLIITSIQDYLPFPKNFLYPLALKKDGIKRDIAYGGGVISFKHMLTTASGVLSIVDVDVQQDLAVLQYTGGTTGIAKGCMLTHYNLVVNTIQAKLWMYRNKEQHPRFLAALPFFHVFGMTVLMNLSIYTAGCLYLVPRFNPDDILKLVDKQGPSVFPGAPTMYNALIHHPKAKDYDLSSIEICISGAATLHSEIQERFEKITGGRLIEGYGLTEASPVTHANNIWEKRKKGSIGIPFPDTLAKIVNPETQETVLPGEAGELAVYGPQVMKGYWNRPEETATVLQDGWLMTGDMATMDPDGFFYILDRKKDLIIASGFNIYPREIEEVLYEHPAVQDAVVIGVPDPYRGETVKAFLVPKTGVELDTDELNRWCRERLAAFKVPRQFEIRYNLPKTLVGKVLKRKLLEEELEKSNSDANHSS